MINENKNPIEDLVRVLKTSPEYRAKWVENIATLIRKEYEERYTFQGINTISTIVGEKFVAFLIKDE